MPLNDVNCPRCGVIEVNHKVSHMWKAKDKWYTRCRCGRGAEILCTLTMKNNDWFRPHWNEGIDWDPVYVKSKKHLKELCLKNNCTNYALGDVRNITEI